MASEGYVLIDRDEYFATAVSQLMGEMGLPLQAVRRQIASGVDLIVHLGRLRDGSRKVLEIVEVDGIREDEIVLHTLFVFEEEDRQEEKGRVKGILRKKGDLLHTEKLKAAGLEAT